MLTFHTRTFVAFVAFSAFALVYISVGLRWHTYRARASFYARQEMEHTFEAARYARVARDPGDSDQSHAQTLSYRKLAEMHQKAARENARLRELYENCW